MKLQLVYLLLLHVPPQAQHQTWLLTDRARRKILRSTTLPKRLLSVTLRATAFSSNYHRSCAKRSIPKSSHSVQNALQTAISPSRYYKLSPSATLLRTCRLLNTNAADIYAHAIRNLTMVIDLSSARRRRSNMSPMPTLDDAQMSRIRDWWSSNTDTLPTRSCLSSSSGCCLAALHIGRKSELILQGSPTM